MTLINIYRTNKHYEYTRTIQRKPQYEAIWP